MRKNEIKFLDLLYNLVMQYFEIRPEEAYFFVVDFYDKMTKNKIKLK